MGKRTTKPKSKNALDVELQRGEVVANFGAKCLISGEDGQVHRCVARRRAGYPVCGDQVQWGKQPNGDGIIASIQPRHSVLERPDRRGHLKPLAANFDQLVVVAAAPPGFDPSLIDRYFVAAEHLGVQPLLVINKADLLYGDSTQEAERLTERYQVLGYASCYASSETEHGMQALNALLAGRTSILVGQSGVGKSSIANRLLPDREIRVGALSESSGLGSHTTTTTILYALPEGGRLIDSPGVREFPLEHLEGPQIAAGFREISEVAEQCRFHNCSHAVEPGCAVRAAVDSGSIHEARYRNYLQLLEERREKAS
jgi:ribosome biogenesis GTPase